MLKSRKYFLLGALLVTLLLSSCSGNEKTVDNYYLSLSGESENWKVDAYEIMSTPDAFKVGNGILTMKNADEYSSDFFSVEVNAVIEGEETSIQMRSVSGSESDITKTSMGTVEGNALHDENGEIISPENISDIYMIIKWREDSDTRKENINLLNKDGFLE